MFHNTGIKAETPTAPLVVNGAQPVWQTLNDARERAFTGEIVFETDPEVFAYLDHGIVYYAERVTDASLGSTTTCTWAMYWDGSANGFSGEDTDSVSVIP